MRTTSLFLLLLLSLLALSCGEQEIIGVPPETYTLQQNYPNPFTDNTRIIYGVPAVGEGNPAPWIRLVVYDRFLQQQATLVNDPAHPAKTDTVLWNGRGVNGALVKPGLYYIELQRVLTSGILTVGDSPDNISVLLRITALKK